MNNQEVLNNNKEDYGPSHKEHIFAQYKLYITGIEKSSDRRQKTNDFFLTINTATLGFMGVVNKVIENDSPFLVLVASIFGIILSIIWYRLINAYRNINRGKYKIIHKLEEQLPTAPYKIEWDILGNGKDKKIYTPITCVEIGVPVMFTILYLIIVSVIYLPYFL